MKNKIILLLSGLIVANTVLGKVGGEEDVFETKEDVFGSNEAQQVRQETTTTNKEVKEESTITNDELKVQVIPKNRINGCKIQKGMDQYIVTSFSTKKELDEVLAKLKPLHTDKAKKLGKKPIIFKYQELIESKSLEPIEETDEFSFESFHVWLHYADTDRFGKLYNALIKYGKPIVFEHVKATYKDEIEKKYDLSNCKIFYRADITSFEEYLKLKKLGIENLYIYIKYINGDSVPEKELKKQLYLYVRDKQVRSLGFVAKRNKRGSWEKTIPIEYTHLCTPTTSLTERILPIFNTQVIENTLFVFNTSIYQAHYIKIQNVECDTLFIQYIRHALFGENVFCKTIICQFHSSTKELQDFITRLSFKKNWETALIGVDSRVLAAIKKGKAFGPIWGRTKRRYSAKVNGAPLRFYDRKKLNDLLKHIHKDKDSTLIIGYVNVKNKPDELSDEEWKQVLVLKQKLKELIKEIQSESIKAPELEEINVD